MAGRNRENQPLQIPTLELRPRRMHLSVSNTLGTLSTWSQSVEGGHAKPEVHIHAS